MRLADRAQRLGESETLAVTRRAKELKAQGKDVISFGAGQPDFPTPSHISSAAKQALDEGHTGYAVPTSGLELARRAVCEKFRRDNQLRYEPSEVIVTLGGKEALYLAFMALLNEGDEVIIPAPYWVSYPEQVRLASGRPVTIFGSEKDGFRITPAQLAAALTPRTRIVVFNYPSNPSGCSYSRRDLNELAAVLAERDVIVFSDEMYDRLIYGGDKHVSWATLNDETYRKTLTFNAASKTFAMTGWRLGYAAGPSQIIGAMAKLQTQMTSGAVNFCQYGLVAALTGEQACVEDMRREYDVRRKLMFEGLRRMPGVTCVEPTGAFYCFPNVSGAYKKLGVTGSTEFATKLLEQAHVAVVPGVAFGSDNHVRLSYAASRQHIQEGISRLARFLT